MIIPSGMLAFNSPAEAADHELGRTIFALGGVANVFALPQFLTVTKSHAVEWDGLVEGIKRSIEDYSTKQHK